MQTFSRTGDKPGGKEAADGVQRHLDGANGAGQRNPPAEAVEHEEGHGRQPDGHREVQQKCGQIQAVVRLAKAAGNHGCLSGVVCLA